MYLESEMTMLLHRQKRMVMTPTEKLPRRKMVIHSFTSLKKIYYFDVILIIDLMKKPVVHDTKPRLRQTLSTRPCLIMA